MVKVKISKIPQTISIKSSLSRVPVGGEEKFRIQKTYFQQVKVKVGKYKKRKPVSA
jgi:hypothetical protein